MRTVLSPRGGAGEALCLFLTGALLGVAIGAGGCARAEKGERKAPVLPAARVDWAQAVTGPRQVTLSGALEDVNKRTNNLLLEGWRIVPGSVALASGHGWCVAMIALEQKPRKGAP